MKAAPDEIAIPKMAVVDVIFLLFNVR